MRKFLHFLLHRNLSKKLLLAPAGNFVMRFCFLFFFSLIITNIIHAQTSGGADRNVVVPPKKRLLGGSGGATSGSGSIAVNRANSALTPDQLVNQIFTKSDGSVTINNVTYKGHGWNQATKTWTSTNRGLGYFNQNGSVFPLSEGLILCTGDIQSVEGPNTSSNGVGNAANPVTGDADLSSLISGVTNVSVLEFDFVPNGSTVQFRYVFGSEEYQYYVNSSYNDVFGFFISGPGITGNKNIALLPTTTTGSSVVAINNVNGGYKTYPAHNCAGYGTNPSNSAYYINVPGDASFGSTCTSTDANLTKSIELNGETVVLTATMNVTPCQTYHIKLAIGNVSDQAFQSAVLLEGKSFSAGGVTNIGNGVSGFNKVYKTCTNNFLRIKRPDAGGTSAVTVNLSYDGPASSTNYIRTYPGGSALPTSVTIPGGQDYVDIQYEVVQGGGASNDVYLNVNIVNACGTQRALQLFLYDTYSNFTATPTGACSGGNNGKIDCAVTGGSGIYQTSFNGGAWTNTMSYTGLAAGTYTIKLRDDNSCYEETRTVQVSELNTLSTTLAPPAICSGSVFSYAPASATGGVTFNWSRAAVAGISQAAASGTNNPNEILTNTTSGVVNVTYVYTLTGNSCTNTQKVIVPVNPLPALSLTSAAATANQTVCTGNAITGITYKYSGGATNTTVTGLPSGVTPVIAGGTVTISGTPTAAPGTYTYTVTTTGAIAPCADVSLTGTIIISQTPTVNAVANQALCNGANITAVNFDGTVSGATYTWTNNTPSIGLAGSGSGNIASFTAVNNGTTPVTATIKVTPSANSCTGTFQSFTITVNPTPTINEINDQVVCNGAATAAVNFSGTAMGTTYTWTNNASSIGLAASGSGNIVAFTSVNTGTAPVTATIVATPSANSCPGQSQTFTIKVNPTPTVNAISNQTVCNGAAITAVSFGGSVSGTTYTWTNTAPSIGLAASGNGDIASFAAVNNGTTPVIATIKVTPSANNCTGTAQTFTITVNPTPTVNTIADQTLCNGANTAAVNFGGSVTGTTYTWTNDAPSIGLVASGTGNITSFAATNNGTAPVTATVTVTPSANTCSGVAKSFAITVNPTPTVNTISNQTVCNGASVAAINFGGTVSGTTYSWTNTASSIGLAASGNGNAPAFTAVNTGTTPVTATIKVTPSANNCSGTAQTFTITVNPTPTVNAITGQTLCNGANTAAVNFGGNVAGATYAWANDAPSIGLAAGGTGNIASFATVNNGMTPLTGTITVIPSANNCSGSAKSFAITVNPTPTVNTISNQTVCNGASVAAINFGGTVSGTTYSWTNTASSIGLAASGNGAVPAFTAVNTGTAPVTATIVVTPSANSCSGAAGSFTITVNPTPSVNVISDQHVFSGANTTTVNFSSTPLGASYTWVNDNTSIGLAASGNDNNIASFTAINNGMTAQVATVKVTPTLAGCVGNIRTFKITVDNWSYTSWKIADKTEIKVNDQITYTIHFKNTGSVTINNITVTDPVPAHTSYVSGGTYNSGANTVTFSTTSANLLPGNETTFVFVVKAANDLTGVTSITNVATVSGGNGDVPTDCNNAPPGTPGCGSNIPTDNAPHYTSWKTADKSEIKVNDQITYTIHFKNTGSVAINTITVTDPVPAHTSYVSGGTYNSGTNTVTFSTTSANLLPGNETTFVFVVQAASDLTGVTSITNVATVNGGNGDVPTDCNNAPPGTAGCGGDVPVDVTPHYTSWKIADKTEIKVNDQITYTLHFKNTGSVAINNITVTDPVPAHTSYVSGGTYNSGTNTVTFATTSANLLPGNETTFVFVVQAASDLTGVTSITNIATVNGGNGDVPTDCNNAPPGTAGCGGDVPVDVTPHYTSWKTADKSEIKVNDQITYTIHFKNTGSVAINNITVTDPVPAHTSYVSGGTYNSGTNMVTFATTSANLLPGNETTFSFQVQAASDLTGVTSITNVATVNGGNGDSTTNCNNAPPGTPGCGGNIPTDNAPHYTSWKAADKSEIKVNDQITYTIHFKNTGSVAINNITVTDPVPAHTSYVSGGTYNSGTNTVTFSTTSANLLPGNETTFSFVVKAASDLTGVTSITNVAKVNGGNGDSTTNCNNAPPGTIGCGGDVPVDVTPHYTSWKTADKTEIKVNDQITYTIHFKNTGSVTINNITVTDPVPAHTSYVSGGTYNSGTNTVTFATTSANLLPDNETTFSFVVKAAGDLTGVTSITNVATVNGGNGDSTTNCNNAPPGTIGCGGDVPVDITPHYTSWKIADKSEIKVNDQITYTIHFKNTGSVTINNITVTDPVPAHTSYVSGGTYNSGTNTVTFSTTSANLLPGNETTFSFVVKAASDLTGVTSITNVATVNGGNGDSTTNCNNAPSGTIGCGGDVPVDVIPHYTSWKTADKTEVKVNDQITYTIHFKNTGSVAINNITVTDPVPAHTSYISGGTYNSSTNAVTFMAINANLLPGNETTFSFQVQAAGDLTGVTSIMNVATVNGDNKGDSTTSCNNAPPGTIGCGGDIPIDTDPHYTSWKTADKVVIKEGDTITYAIHFKNVGNVAINNIVVTDPVPQHTTYISGGAYSANTNTVTFGATTANLLPGTEIIFLFKVKAANDLTGVTSITNVAKVNGGNGDSTTNCNNAPPGTVGCGGAIPVDDNIIGVGPVCVNATLALRTTVTGGVWSSYNTGIAQINANTGVVTGISAGIARISYTANGKTVQADITVNPLPVVPAITGQTNICIDGGGGTLSNTVLAGAWSSDNTSIVTIDVNTGVMTGKSAGNGVIKYTVTDALTKCQTTVQATITVYPMPVVPAITGSTQVCEQSSINLSNTVTGGLWSSSDPAIASVDNNGKVTGVAYGEVVISYAVKNNGGCTTIVKKTILVNKKPAITTVAISPVCAPNTIDLRTGISNYDANNYSYTFTDAAGIAVANPAAVSVTGIYNVTAENKVSSCGADMQTLQAVINPKPVVNVVTFTPGEVCAPSTVNIQSLITNYDATTYNYSYTDQYGNAVATPTAVSASGSYSITATDKMNDTHCSSQPVTVVVTVNPQPVITIVNNGNMVLCGNAGTVDLTTGITDYNTGYTYTYTDAGGNLLSNVSAIGIPGTYYVTAKDNKCSSVKTAITLTRYATPVVTITDPAAVYDPYTVDITAAAVTAGSTADLTYAYYNSSNVLITTADAQKISGPGSYTYYLQGTSAQGCKSNTAPVHVLIKDRPVLSISSAEIWEGQKATLTLSLPTDVILPDAITVALNTRYPGSTIVKGDYDKPDKVIVPANTNSVTFVVNTWDNNVLDHDRILILEGGNTIYNVTPGTVLIHDSTSLKPQNLIITIGRDTIYSRGTATVRVKLPDGISTSYPITVNVFEAAGSTIAGMDYNMDANAEIPAGTGSGILHVTVPATADHDRELKISGAASGFIVKDGGVYIRKSRINVVPLVSDNGDGINDFLKIEGIERYTSKFGGSNNVILFSRWEEVIYEAGNYDNTTIKFNGRGNKRGAERVPDGVYFYAITIEIPDNELGVGEPKKQTFKGYFRLQK